jgi:CO/xanthine dehydrogenase FAD-binding subunit
MQSRDDVSYWKASTLKEVVHILSEEEGKARIIAGGTDLLVQRKEGRWLNLGLLDIWKNKELDYIKEVNGSIRIGALTSQQSLLESPIIQKYAKPLHQSAMVFASPQIRNRATLGGNIVNSSPAADSLPALYILNARVKLVSESGEREIPIQDFFTGPGKNVKRDDELLSEITIQKMKLDDKWGYIKLGQRGAMAIALVGIGVIWSEDKTTGKLKECKISYGAVAPTVIRAIKTEDFLKKKKLTPSVIHEAGKIAQSEVKPISDVRASAEYRLAMCDKLLQRILLSSYE